MLTYLKEVSKAQSLGTFIKCLLWTKNNARHGQIGCAPRREGACQELPSFCCFAQKSLKQTHKTESSASSFVLSLALGTENVTLDSTKCLRWIGPVNVWMPTILVSASVSLSQAVLPGVQLARSREK